MTLTISVTNDSKRSRTEDEEEVDNRTKRESDRKLQSVVQRALSPEPIHRDPYYDPGSVTSQFAAQ